MGFLENIGENLQKKTSEATAKAKEMIEITNLNNQVSKIDKSIQKRFQQIGEQQYTYMKKGIPVEYADIIQEIDKLNEEKKEIMKNIAVLKGEEGDEEVPSGDGKRTCPGCGVEVADDAAFCSSCGTMINP